MSELQALYPYLAAIAALAACLAAAVAVLSRCEARRLQRGAGAEIERLQRDLHALCAGAVGLGDRLGGVERTLRQLAERQQRLALKDPGERPYAQAIRLVQGGAGIEQLTETCGLTRGEAELIIMLHGVDQAS